jgi:hypothetical protein
MSSLAVTVVASPPGMDREGRLGASKDLVGGLSPDLVPVFGSVPCPKAFSASGPAPHRWRFSFLRCQILPSLPGWFRGLLASRVSSFF